MLPTDRAIRDEKSKIIENFCGCVRDLIDVGHNLMPDNEEIMLLQTGARFTANHVGNILVEEIGPEVYKFRNEIASNNFDFIRNINFNQQIDDRKDLLKMSNVNQYKKLIPIILRTYDNCTQSEQNNIHTIIKNILLYYIHYIMHEKKYGDD